MFEQAVLSSGPAAKRVWTTSVGLMGQAVAVGSLVLLSVVWPQALPIATILTRLEAPGPPPPPPGPHVVPKGTFRRLVPVSAGAFVAPSVIPADAPRIVDPPAEVANSGVDGGIGPPGGVRDGVIGAILREVAAAPPPPARPVETARAATTPKPVAAPTPRIVRVSELRMARLIHRVEPVYPQLAKQARVQGPVQIEAIIAVDGHMRDLRVVSGHPLLVNAAIDAVRQWIYEPTVLNGERVEVSAPITVNFKLNN